VAGDLLLGDMAREAAMAHQLERAPASNASAISASSQKW
jgi:hypothetical protein